MPRGSAKPPSSANSLPSRLAPGTGSPGYGSRATPPHYTLGQHTEGVTAVAVGELDGRPIVVSGGGDSTVRGWGLGTGEPVGDPVTRHIKRDYAVAVGELDGRPIVVSGGGD